MQRQEIKSLQIKTAKTLADSLGLFVHNYLGLLSATTNFTQAENKMDPSDDIFISLFFTGQVHGEFIIGTKKQYLFSMLKLDPKNETHFDEAVDFLSEAVNVASGYGLKIVAEHFKKVTLTAPRTILGYLKLPPTVVISRFSLIYGTMHINCYSYIDLMRLDLATTFTETIDKLSNTYRELSDAKVLIENSTQEKEELKRLSHAKTQFLANMSHELRTPLNGMIGMLDLVKRTDLTLEQQSQIDIVAQSGDFLLSIINDILEFSKVESGKLEIESVEFDLRKCIDDLMSALANQVFQKGLELLVFMDDKLPKFIVSDQIRIKQVLMNLIGNAIKFTPSGEIFVEVKALPSTEENLNTVILQFSVSDTGIGIPADKLEKIFFSFSQADASDTRKYGGSGLGLTISKNIVETMAGTLIVDSKEAFGSKFYFEIPVHFIQQNSRLASVPEEVFYLTTNPRLRKILHSYIISIGFIPVETRSLNQLFDSALNSKNSNLNLLVDGLLISDLNLFESKVKALPGPNIYTCILGPQMQLADFKSLLTSIGQAYFMQKPVRYNELKDALYKKTTFTMQSTKRPREEKVAGKVEQKSLDKKVQARNLLLVEDNKTNQKVAQLMLESVGWKCVIADNGKIAVDIISNMTSDKISDNSQFDLILMDCQMPEMDGFQATQEIRQLESVQGKRTPIIAMTANAFRETKERCFSSGMDNFITKPIKIEQLSEIIEDTLLKLQAS